MRLSLFTFGFTCLRADHFFFEPKDIPTSRPEGSAPIQLYSLATPNGQKITIALEEMGLAYDAHTIEISKGIQFQVLCLCRLCSFFDINPMYRNRSGL